MCQNQQYAFKKCDELTFNYIRGLGWKSLRSFYKENFNKYHKEVLNKYIVGIEAEDIRRFFLNETGETETILVKRDPNDPQSLYYVNEQDIWHEEWEKGVGIGFEKARPYSLFQHLPFERNPPVSPAIGEEIRYNGELYGIFIIAWIRVQLDMKLLQHGEIIRGPDRNFKMEEGAEIPEKYKIIGSCNENHPLNNPLK